MAVSRRQFAALSGGAIVGACGGCGSNTEAVRKRRGGIALVLTSLEAGKTPGDAVRFILRNQGNFRALITSVSIRDGQGARLSSSPPGGAVSSVVLDAGEVAFGVIWISASPYNDELTLEIEYRSGSEQFSTGARIGPLEIWSILRHCGLKSREFLLLIRGYEPQDGHQRFALNGIDVDCSEYSTLPVGDSVLSVFRLRAGLELEAGQTAYATMHSGPRVYGGAVRTLPFETLRGTPFDIVLRPIFVKHETDRIVISLYNESDFRKSSVEILGISVNGKPIGNAVVRPSSTLPPDPGGYENDCTNIAAKMSEVGNSELHRFEVRYRRQRPVDANTLPRDYLDVRSLRFTSMRGLELPLDVSDQLGIRSGATVWHAGLRQDTTISTVRERCRAISTIAPRVRRSAFAPRGLRKREIAKLEGFLDFVNIFQPYSEGVRFRDRVSRGKMFIDAYSLPPFLPWAAACVLREGDAFGLDDLLWLQWSVVGLGGKSMSFTLSSTGEKQSGAEDFRKLTSEAQAGLRPVSHLIARGYPVKLSYQCDQGGVAAYFLICGVDDILMVVLNNWSTRAARFGKLPSHFPVRTGISVSVDLGPKWVPSHVAEPSSGSEMSVSSGSGKSISIELPQFSSACVLHISRRAPTTRLNTYVYPPSEPFELLSSPVFDLGVIRPGSSSLIKVRIRSKADRSIKLTPCAVDGGKNLGTWHIPDCKLPANMEASLSVQYTAPQSVGESVTPLILESKSQGVSIPLFICADVGFLVTASPSLVQFPKTSMSKPGTERIVRVISSFGKASIVSVSCDAPYIDLRVEAERKSVQVSLKPPIPLGAFETTIILNVRLEEQNTPESVNVKVRGEGAESIVATPSEIQTFTPGGPMVFNIRIKHLRATKLTIDEVRHGSNLSSDFEKQKYTKLQVVKISIDPDQLKEGVDTIVIKGRLQGGSLFVKSLPVRIRQLKDVPGQKL